MLLFQVGINKDAKLIIVKCCDDIYTINRNILEG